MAIDRGLLGFLGPKAGGLRLEGRVEALRQGGLAQLLERAGLELAHPLAREAERLADLLEGVLLLAAEAIAQAPDQLLARGILPIALGRGTGGESRVPMGIAVVGGVFFSTLLIFFLAPATYVVIDRALVALRRLRERTGRAATAAAARP